MSYIEWIRSQVGHLKIILVFSSVVLRDLQGSILLQRRTDFNVWGLPGGILETGEGILDCVHRELLEETGLIAADLNLVGIYTDPQWDTVYPNGDQVQQYTVCFQGVASGGHDLPDGVETSAQQFFEPSRLPMNEIPAYYVAMIRDALDSSQPAFSPPFTSPSTISQIETLRPVIGKWPYICPGAAVVIPRHDGRVLMVGYKDNGDWEFPGGPMRLGENAAHTAVREARQKVGLAVAPERILGIDSLKQARVDPNEDQVQFVNTYFYARPVEGTSRIHSSEIRKAAWLAPKEILALEVHPERMELYRAIVQHLEGGYFVL